jgi:argininosuccinate lyase
MKAVPLTYSKDMQEDKEPLFDALETVDISLDVFAGAWEGMEVFAERMEASIDSMALATDLADYLVHKGVPFREAHRIIGNLVRAALAEDRALTAFKLADLHAHSEDFGEDALVLLDVRHSLELRNIEGGTGPQAVAEQLEKARGVLAAG